MELVTNINSHLMMCEADLTKYGNHME